MIPLVIGPRLPGSRSSVWPLDLSTAQERVPLSLFPNYEGFKFLRFLRLLELDE